ncbi:hypothetical protein Hanom_Chr13g01188601 [Helianthus anomalus]
MLLTEVTSVEMVSGCWWTHRFSCFLLEESHVFTTDINMRFRGNEIRHELIVGSVLFRHNGKHENIPLIASVQASRESRWRRINKV